LRPCRHWYLHAAASNGFDLVMQWSLPTGRALLQYRWKVRSNFCFGIFTVIEFQMDLQGLKVESVYRALTLRTLSVQAFLPVILTTFNAQYIKSSSFSSSNFNRLLQATIIPTQHMDRTTLAPAERMQRRDRQRAWLARQELSQASSAQAHAALALPR